MDNYQAVNYLESLLGRTLRIQTTDTRLFVGLFKCSDNDRNLILANTYEYRFPRPAGLEDANIPQRSPAAPAEGNDGDGGVVTVDMTSRFIGLVVVPGQYITKIELAEFPRKAATSKGSG